ncbi:MAG: hypothetical protein AB8Z06_01035, partial [Coxiella endosymbiont of Haemaphysalis qinghaiensis]
RKYQKHQENIKLRNFVNNLFDQREAYLLCNQLIISITIHAASYIKRERVLSKKKYPLYRERHDGPPILLNY